MARQSEFFSDKTVPVRSTRILFSPHRFASLFGIAFTFLLSFFLCAIPLPSNASPKNLQEQIHIDLNTVDKLLPEKPIHFRIRVVPAPSRQNPVHLHIYLDNRMLQMLTLTHSVTTIHLPPLAPGRHSVVFIEANPLTHRPMTGSGGGDMSGVSSDLHMMDMGEGSGMNMQKMSDNLTEIPARFRMKTLTLDVLPR